MPRNQLRVQIRVLATSLASWLASELASCKGGDATVELRGIRTVTAGK